MTTTRTQTVFSSASPFAAAPEAPAVDPPTAPPLSGSEAITVVNYIVKIVGEGTEITPELLASVVEKVQSGVLMTAAQTAGPARIAMTAASEQRRAITRYFGLVV